LKGLGTKKIYKKLAAHLMKLKRLEPNESQKRPLIENETSQNDETAVLSSSFVGLGSSPNLKLMC
jgi:hypothetical protein